MAGAWGPGCGMITAAFWCLDCEAYHRRQVIVWHGRIAPSVVLGAGPGAGYQYNLTGEDLGETDGLSVPVYRPVAAVAIPDLPPLLLGKVPRIL